MILFLTSLTVVVVMLVEKLFFFRLEKQYAASFLGIAEIIFYVVTLILGIVFFFKNKNIKKKSLDGLGNEENNKFLNKFNLLVVVFGIATLSVIFLSFYLNYIKVSIHWDAVALYDARATFITYGMKFSDMPSLAKFDNLNQYYYLLYPPYTSVAHFMWKGAEITKQIPVSVYYSIVLVFFALLTYLIGKERFGLLIGTILAFLVSSNSSIVNVVVKEYTNLPFDLYIVGGVLLLYSYLRKGEFWKYLFGVLMVSTSLWIRLLEPIWLAITIAFILAIFSKEKVLKSVSLCLFLLFFCLLEYYSWNYFTNTVAHNPGFLNFTKLNIIDTFVGVFTGAPIIVVATVAKSWGIPFFIHLTALIGLILRPKYVLKNKPLLFLGLVVLMSMLMYFSQFYVLSFQADWWSIVAMSLDRSSTFLIPVSGFILFDLILSSSFFKRSN